MAALFFSLSIKASHILDQESLSDPYHTHSSIPICNDQDISFAPLLKKITCNAAMMLFLAGAL